MRATAQSNLRKAGQEYRANPNADTLREVHHQAFLMISYDPKAGKQVLDLVDELLKEDISPTSSSASPMTN